MTALTQPLDEILSSRAKVRVCRLLLTTSEPLSAREMGRRTGTVKRSVDLALVELTELGLVIRDGSSAFSAYRMNEQHVLVDRALKPLFMGEAHAVDAVFTTLRELVEPANVATGAGTLWAGVFGSMARGDETTSSDIDLAVIVDGASEVSWLHDAISTAAPSFAKHFGRRLSPLVMSREQFVRMFTDHDPLAVTLTRESRRIAGTVLDLEKMARG